MLWNEGIGDSGPECQKVDKGKWVITASVLAWACDVGIWAFRNDTVLARLMSLDQQCGLWCKVTPG